MGLISSVGSAVLARSVGVLAENPLPLQETGGLLKWVLEQPLPLTIVLALAGVVLWFAMRSQGKERDGIRIAGVLLVLAVGAQIAGMLVETQGEKLKAQTKELVAAVSKADATRVSPMLTEDAYVQPFGFRRDVMLTMMDKYLGNMIKIKEHHVSSLRAAVESGTSARTQFRVHVVSDSSLYGGPVGSWWMLRWRKDSTGVWKVAEIEMQQIDGADVSSLRP